MKTIHFFIVVLLSISISNLFIVFAEPDTKIIYSSWILIINSLIASLLSVLVLLKDKDGDNHDKTKIHLAIGLFFWFIANVIWGYYEIALEIVSPVPSLADVFLLSAYGFLIYRLIITYSNIAKAVNKKILAFIVSITVLFLVYILYLTLDVSELSSFKGIMLFVVTIAYPVLNSILTIFALIILIGVKDDKHHFIPWITELVGLLAIVIGDSWFAIIVLTSFVEQLWISSLLLSAHYLLIAGGLVWYMRHSIKWGSRDMIFRIVITITKHISKKIISGLIVITGVSIILILYVGNVIIDNSNGYLINKSSFDVQSFMDHKNGKKEFVIGAIIPFTGSLSSIGKSVKIALDKAEGDVNKYFNSIDSPYSINLLMGDSKTNPQDSLILIKKLHDNGANIIVGPATSTAVSAVKDFADAHNITLISYASTSPLLSIEGDNLFRLVPDDTNQGKIIAEKMFKEGIKVIVPFFRGDVYGTELYNSTKSNFLKMGGKVEEGIKYEPHTGSFATSLHRINFIMWNQELKKLNAVVSETVKRYGSNSVGVYIISYDEIAPILIQASNYEVLGKVRWYGSDSIAQSSKITKNTDAADFAIKTNLTNPLYSINGDSKKIVGLEEDLEKKLHEIGSITYPAIAYDSYWLASLSLYKNATINFNKNYTINSFKNIVFDTAKYLDGISGKILLNPAGDRVSENYDFWMINKNDRGYEWEKENISILNR